MLIETAITAPKRGEDAMPYIFIVDDEAMIGEVVEVILNLEGFRPKFFQDPQAALTAYLEETPRPELLLTDFLMHPINGMELIQHCKAACPELKTILYSGNVGEDIMQFYPIRPDGFLSKPFLPKNLVKMVNSLLNLPQRSD